MEWLIIQGYFSKDWINAALYHRLLTFSICLISYLFPPPGCKILESRAHVCTFPVVFPNKQLNTWLLNGWILGNHPNHSGCINNSSHSPFGTGKARFYLCSQPEGHPCPPFSREQAGVAVTENGRENLDSALVY